MFTQLGYSRRPVITTYRRKTRVEQFIDSSDDDSDSDEQQQQQQQQRSSIPKEQHAPSLPLQNPVVQQQHQELPPPTRQVLSPVSCSPEKLPTGLPLTDPTPSSHLSVTTTTDTIAYVSSQKQQSKDAEDMSMLDLLPLDHGLNIPGISTDPLLLSLPLPQRPSSPASKLLVVQEEVAASSSFSTYGETPFQNTPQDTFDFDAVGMQVSTTRNDISLLVFPSQPALLSPPCDGAGLPPASAVTPPHSHPPQRPDTHQEQALDAFDSLESPFSTTREALPSSLATVGSSTIPQQNTLDPFALLPPQQQQQQQQQLIEQDIFDFPELPPQRPPLSLQQQSTGKQPDVFDLPSLPPPTLTTPSVQQKHSTTPKKDIFDFPDEDPNDEVIVASPLSLQHHNKKKKKKTPMAPLPPPPPDVNGNRPSAVKQRQRKQVRFAPDMLVSTFQEQSFERVDALLLPVQEKQKKKRTTVADENRPPQHLPLIQTLKRKRNLISGLKSAAGVPATQGQLRRYAFDDDDDDDDEETVSASASATKLQLRGDEGDGEEYEQATPSWLDLAAESEEERSPVSHRPQYQPQNPMNVRVTYGRHRASASQDPEMAELDNLLAQLRDCK